MSIGMLKTSNKKNKSKENGFNNGLYSRVDTTSDRENCFTSRLDERKL